MERSRREFAKRAAICPASSTTIATFKERSLEVNQSYTITTTAIRHIADSDKRIRGSDTVTTAQEVVH